MIDPFRCNSGYHFFLKCVELLKSIRFLPECEEMSANGLSRTKVRLNKAEQGTFRGPSSLIGWVVSQQYSERQEWPDGNELLVHEVFLRERQAFDEARASATSLQFRMKMTPLPSPRVNHC
jgi:hypothetical protein